MWYFDYLDYKDMDDNPDNYFKNKRVINFDIINHWCWGDQLQKSIRENKTIICDGFSSYAKAEEKVMSAIFRNVDRDDLWVKRDMMIKHLKENFQ